MIADDPADGMALDGNAAAGDLQDVFGMDVTTARGRCAHCGRVAVLAQARLFARAPGLVLRCDTCTRVLLTLVRAPGRTWLGCRGLSVLELPGP